jgi:molybdopterin synthase catalytic subunit
MAEREMSKIVKQMRDQWELERVSIAHRTGVCPVGEASVIIAVSSAHRKEALEAAHFAIDTLKATVPIWKKVTLIFLLELFWRLIRSNFLTIPFAT